MSDSLARQKWRDLYNDIDTKIMIVRAALKNSSKVNIHKIWTSTHKPRQTLGAKHTSSPQREKKKEEEEKCSRRSADF